MTDTSKTTNPVNTEHHFSGCPECGDTDGYESVGPSHWFVCDRHMTKWLIGSNIFSSWRDQTEADWEHAAAVLEKYREIEPLPMIDDGEAV